RLWGRPCSRHQRRDEHVGRGAHGVSLWRDGTTGKGFGPRRRGSAKEESPAVRRGKCQQRVTRLTVKVAWSEICAIALRGVCGRNGQPVQARKGVADSLACDSPQPLSVSLMGIGAYSRAARCAIATWRLKVVATALRRALNGCRAAFISGYRYDIPWVGGGRFSLVASKRQPRRANHS